MSEKLTKEKIEKYFDFLFKERGFYVYEFDENMHLCSAEINIKNADLKISFSLDRGSYFGIAFANPIIKRPEWFDLDFILQLLDDNKPTEKIKEYQSLDDSLSKGYAPFLCKYIDKITELFSRRNYQATKKKYELYVYKQQVKTYGLETVTGWRTRPSLELSLKEEILLNLKNLTVQKQRKLSAPVEYEIIEKYEKQHGIDLPFELRQCNGVDYANIFGINQDSPNFEIAGQYKNKTSWKEKGWIPVGSDENGNFYILDTIALIRKTHPVYFMDQTDFSKPAYVAASGLWQFLRFKIVHEIYSAAEQNDRWPFKKEAVIGKDPNITLCKTAPLPWEIKNLK